MTTLYLLLLSLRGRHRLLFALLRARFVNSSNLKTPWRVFCHVIAIDAAIPTSGMSLPAIIIVILKNKLEYMHKGNSFVHGMLSLYL